jgi:hypothetical protein
MKIPKMLMIAAVLVLVLSYAFCASAGLGYMRISLIENETQIKTTEANEWGFAAINTPMAEGDEIWVPQGSRAELQLNSGTYIRLDGGTALQVLSVDEDSSQFYLSQGRTYVFYDAPRGSVIQIDTPDASTRAFERAIFDLSMSDQYTDVAVYKGYVETENQVGESRVNAGEMLSLGPDTDGEVAPVGPADEWEAWNGSRNERLYAAKESESARYLPSQLRTYSSDLDSSGRWVHVPEYGYVWTPRAFVSVSWTPYREGRWIWRGGDYVWVSYEPWGWVPYHYGRWAFAPAIGWFWVPPARGAVYWGPGYVGWVRTDDYVAWVPLAPGEIYYGRGYFGHHSVNITKVNINHIHVTNVYKNVTIHNGPVIVNRHSFQKGHHGKVHVDEREVREKIFTPKNMRPGAPDIKPVKGSYFPSDREIPADKLPPQQIRKGLDKEHKKQRQLVREADRSVLNPGTAPKDLPKKKVDTPRTPGKGKPKLEKMETVRQEQPVAPEAVREEKKERQRLQPEEQQGKPNGPEGGRKTREKTKQQPIDQQQQQPKLQPQPAAPDGGPAETREQQQLQPEQRRKPNGPEGGRKTREKTKQQPVEQQQQPELQPQPAAPDGGPAETREQQQLQPEQRRKPAGPEGGRRTREKTKQQPDEQQQQPELLMQPARPDAEREIRRERRPAPEKQMQPLMPDEGRRTREKAKQQPPVQQQQPEPQFQPARPDAEREIRRERRQVQPEQQMQPVAPDEGRRRKDKGKQQQEAPECGPGQKDANNPEKCPQNFRR